MNKITLLLFFYIIASVTIAQSTFHLNYTKNKKWELCAQRDYVIFDMFETSLKEFQKCQELGKKNKPQSSVKMYCYFSSQFEDWRPDANEFGKLGKSLEKWKGEKWVDPNDPKNLKVMLARLKMAKARCQGIDLDNIDGDMFGKKKTGFIGYDDYILKIFKAAKDLGLEVSQKNYPEKINYFASYVDVYQTEECQQYDECFYYEKLNRPVFNIEYKKSTCHKIPYLFSVIKDRQKMDSAFTLCE